MIHELYAGIVTYLYLITPMPAYCADLQSALDGFAVAPAVFSLTHQTMGGVRGQPGVLRNPPPPDPSQLPPQQLAAKMAGAGLETLALCSAECDSNAPVTVEGKPSPAPGVTAVMRHVGSATASRAASQAASRAGSPRNFNAGDPHIMLDPAAIQSAGWHDAATHDKNLMNEVSLAVVAGEGTSFVIRGGARFSRRWRR